MNANELADWIENGAPFGKHETAKQAVVMLRQQQAEISVSENLVKHLHSENRQLRAENEQQQAEIEKLKDEVAEWKMSYENCHRMCSGYGMN